MDAALSSPSLAIIKLPFSPSLHKDDPPFVQTHTVLLQKFNQTNFLLLRPGNLCKGTCTILPSHACLSSLSRPRSFHSIPFFFFFLITWVLWDFKLAKEYRFCYLLTWFHSRHHSLVCASWLGNNRTYILFYPSSHFWHWILQQNPGHH